MSAENKVPEIRFEGFSGEWAQSNLAKCTDLLTGNPFNSKEFTANGILLVRGMNVKRGYLDASPEISEFWPSSKGLENYLLEPEDIVIQMDGALIGKSYAKIESINLPAILVQRVTRVRCSEVNPEFIYQYIQKDFLNHISGIKTETAVPHLSLHDIRGFSVSLPKRPEQNAIGNYFQKLDTLINRHQQKYDKLCNFKKSLQGKMFPKQGETMPEIRFKGFSGEWEEKGLGTDVAEIIGGGTPSTAISEFWDGDIDWYSPTEIGNNVYAEGSQKKITALGLKNSSAKILPAGNTVLFTSRAGIGDMAILAKPGATNQGFQSFIVKEGFSPYFIYSAGKKIKEFALKHASGSTFLEISGKQLGRMKILMPGLEEQTAIGNYFQKLDSLINKQQQQITKLNNIKQACLSKMFV